MQRRRRRRVRAAGDTGEAGEEAGEDGDGAAAEGTTGTRSASRSDVYDYVVVGAGIAGVSCVEELRKMPLTQGSSPRQTVSVLLLAAGDCVRQPWNVKEITEHLHTFEVREQSLEEFVAQAQELNMTGKRLRSSQGQEQEHTAGKEDATVTITLDVVQGSAQGLDVQANVLELEGGQRVRYGKLCICTGARPRCVVTHPNVVGMRDTTSVEEVSQRVRDAKRVVILGNGGIALELAHALRFCEVLWVVRHDYIGNVFFDATSSAFIMPELHRRMDIPFRDHCASAEASSASSSSSSSSAEAAAPPPPPSAATGPSQPQGSALGPDWIKNASWQALNDGDAPLAGMHIEFECELDAIRDLPAGAWERVARDGAACASPATFSSSAAAAPAAKEGEEDMKGFPIAVRLSNGHVYGCDFVVSATGVVPNVEWCRDVLDCASAGPGSGIVVDERLRTAASEDVFAAGDCCSVVPRPEAQFGDDPAVSPLWFQMRLWSQARTMGRYAAACLAGQVDELGAGMAFEVFAHTTRFFGYKVVLLGKYNAQGLGEAVTRTAETMVVTERGLVHKDDRRYVAQGTTAVQDAQQAPAEEQEQQEEQERHAEEKSEAGGSTDVELWARLVPTKEYVKLVVQGGRIVGAMLVGDTDLEECIENLILNRTDVSRYGIELLNPDVDIEDYFD